MRTAVLVLSTTFWTLVLTAVAAAQAVGGAWERHGPKVPAFYGSGCSFEPVSDRDGDGLPEIAVQQARVYIPGVGLRATLDIHSGADGRRVHRFWYGAGWTFLASEPLESLGDLDGDGVPELGTFGEHDQLAPDRALLIHSGADGALLRRAVPPTVGESFGRALVSIGDLDGDSVPEYAAGSAGGLGLYPGVLVFRGSDGALLRRFAGGSLDEFGTSLAAPGDLDGDGVPDLVVGAPGEGAPQQGASWRTGVVRAYSGATGAELWRAVAAPWEGPETHHGDFGFALDFLGDVDGDGIADILVGARTDGGGGTRGAVYGVSGADGRRLWRALGSGAAIGFGTSVAGVGDVDGDGDPDAAVGDPWFGPSPSLVEKYGEVQVLDGASGSLLCRSVGPTLGTSLGFGVEGLGDLDGDGLPEIGASATGWLVASQEAGLHFLSFDPFLTPAYSEVSLATTQSLPFRLSFPASEAGMRFSLLASVTDPDRKPWLVSTSVAGIPIPLDDSRLLRRMSAGWAPVGTLDAQGRATVDVRVPPFPNLLAGRTLHFAALTVDPQTGVGRLSSGARAVRFLP